jgi:hypothetical protein
MSHRNGVYITQSGYVPHPDLDKWFMLDLQKIDSTKQLRAHMDWMEMHLDRAPLHHSTYDNYKRYKKVHDQK